MNPLGLIYKRELKRLKANAFYFCLTKSSTHVCVFSDVARSHAIGSGSATGRSSNALLLRMPAGVARRDGGHMVSFFDIARLLLKSLEARQVVIARLLLLRKSADTVRLKIIASSLNLIPTPTPGKIF